MVMAMPRSERIERWRTAYPVGGEGPGDIGSGLFAQGHEARGQAKVEQHHPRQGRRDAVDEDVGLANLLAEQQGLHQHQQQHQWHDGAQRANGLGIRSLLVPAGKARRQHWQHGSGSLIGQIDRHAEHREDREERSQGDDPET
jgi:hypothetical protein